MRMELGGMVFRSNFVVVSPLTSEAILGIDFLKAQRAIIDMGRGMLCLQESGCNIPLDPLNPLYANRVVQAVCVTDRVEVPPWSVMEITAHFDTEVRGVWLVEAAEKEMPVAVAHSLVEPSSTVVPVCVMNTSDQPVTLYAGSTIGKLVEVDPPAEVGVVAASTETPEVEEEEKRKKLQQLVLDSCMELLPVRRTHS